MEEKKRFHSFSVEVVSNGFIVTIGCQKLIFKTLSEMASKILEYEADPHQLEKELLANSLCYDEQPVLTQVLPCGSISIGSGE